MKIELEICTYVNVCIIEFIPEHICTNDRRDDNITRVSSGVCTYCTHCGKCFSCENSLSNRNSVVDSKKRKKKKLNNFRSLLHIIEVLGVSSVLR